MIGSIIFQKKHAFKSSCFLTYQNSSTKRPASHTRLAPANEGSRTSTVTQQRWKPANRKSTLSLFTTFYRLSDENKDSNIKITLHRVTRRCTLSLDRVGIDLILGVADKCDPCRVASFPGSSRRRRVNRRKTRDEKASGDPLSEAFLFVRRAGFVRPSLKDTPQAARMNVYD